MAAYSPLLQLLLDAENPVRIAVGDARELSVRCLHDLGLVDYRKSGWWATSEAGHRLVGGSINVEGFLVLLELRAKRVAHHNSLLQSPVGRSHKSKREAARAVHSAELVLGWLREGRA